MRRCLAPLLVGLIAASCQTPEPTSPAPPPAASTPLTVPPPTVVALSTSPATSASSGWSPVPAPSARTRPRPGPITDLPACAAELRTGAWAEDDEAMPDYERGLVAERASDLATARKAYYDVIQRFPASRLVPLAYLAFGELFAREAATDPSKWELARMAYLKVLEYPPTQSPIHAYATLRVADAEQAGSDDAKALRHYQLAATSGREQPCAGFIHDQAIKGAIRSYGKSGQPDRAYAFFQRLTAGNDEEARAAVRELAEAYRSTGDRAGACRAVTPVDGASSPLCRP